jgi:hypothetical protein
LRFFGGGLELLVERTVRGYDPQALVQHQKRRAERFEDVLGVVAGIPDQLLLIM